MIVIQKDGVNFELNKNNLTARVIRSPDARGHVVLPRSINYQSQEYIITRINEKSFKNNFNVCSIDFVKDSAVQSIGKNAFSLTDIDSLTIPSNLENFEEGWCSNALNLNHIYISPDNKHFKFLDNNKKIIIGKSDPKSDTYDSLIFGIPSLDSLFIPSTIKHINSYAFSACLLCSIEFESNSQLKTIGKSAFDFVKMKKFVIPSCVNTLEDGWFDQSFNTEVLISEENNGFSYLNQNDRIIIQKSNLIYAPKTLQKVKIPSSIKHINSRAFEYCESLNEIEFSEDSQLISIGDSAFLSTPIEKITIPSSVEYIGKMVFELCRELLEINFEKNSKLHSIRKRIFRSTGIKSFVIHSNINELEAGWCNETLALKKIEIDSDNKNFCFLDENQKIVVGKSDTKSDIFDVIEFACRDIQMAIIPSSIKLIKPFAFANCYNLKSVEFGENSQLESIGKSAFLSCSLKSIKIPSSVVKIGNEAFKLCVLKSVELSKDSQLKMIGDSAFSDNPIKEFFFPSKIECFTQVSKFNNDLKKIVISPGNKWLSLINYDKSVVVKKSNINNKNFDSIVHAFGYIEKVFIPSTIEYIKNESFQNCGRLKIVEFEKNSQLKTIDYGAFCNTAIEKITIPSSVTFIGPAAFYLCDNLKKVEFEENSKLKFIESETFKFSSIEYLSIPSSIQKLKSSWCDSTMKLNNVFLSPLNPNLAYLDIEKKLIVGKSNPQNNVYDVLVFACRDIKEAVIPSSIKIIDSYSFQHSSVEKVRFSKSLNRIEKKAFDNCKSLKNVEFEGKLESISVGIFAFFTSSIEYLSINAHSISIEMSALMNCKLLKTAELDGENMVIDSFFSNNNLSLVSFPNANYIRINFVNDYFLPSKTKDFRLFVRPGIKIQ